MKYSRKISIVVTILTFTTLTVVDCFGQGAALPQPATDNVKARYTEFPTEAEALKADPAYQDAIADLVEARRYPGGVVSEKTRAERVARCMDLAKDDHLKLLRQAVVYSATKSPRAEEDPVLAVVGLVDWAKDPKLLILTIIPLLNSPDPKVQQSVRIFQGRAEAANAVLTIRGYEDFFTFYDIRGWPLPRALVENLFHKNPSETLLTLDAALRTNAEQRRQLRWTEHVVSDFIWKKQNNRLNGDSEKTLAQEELVHLLSDPRWWARLFVAEILDNYAELRTPDALKKLGQDDDPAIKAIYSKWKPEKP